MRTVCLVSGGMNTTSPRRTISPAMRTDQAKHRKALERFKGVTLNVTADGVITYPQGRDALREIEARLANEYAKQKEQDRKEAYERATIVTIKQCFPEEDMDLVRAVTFFKTWEERLEYLRHLGYTELQRNRLEYRVKVLKKSRQWQDIVKVATGKMTHEFVDPYCYTYRYDPTQPDCKGELIKKHIPNMDEYNGMAVATEMHVSAADCKKRNSKYNWAVLIPQVQELLDKGMTVAEIAKELSINAHSLHTRLRRYPLEKARQKT